MKRRARSLIPSPALAVACVALFVSLGGVSYAVATGSIDSREIKNNTVRAKDLRSGSVTASEIRRRSLDGTDIKIERVGGNAVKEQVLEVSKLRKVPSAVAADNGTRWALVNESGAIEAQSGGFTVVSCYNINANCYLNAGSDVRDNGLVASISVNNTDASPVLAGETGVAACGATTVNCAPPGTEDNNVLVVAPRESDGTAFGAGVATAPVAAADAARFYVVVSGS